jgi:hypothetical protein
MDSLTDTTKIYTVQPGCRYVIAYEGTDGAATITAGWKGDGDPKPFKLADGTTTEDSDISGEDSSGGWEVLAPTGKIHVTVSGTVNVTCSRVEN